MAELTAAGLEPRRLDSGTGALCDIGDGPGFSIALRADIDALPIQDMKDAPYRSTQEGICHACGHDVHTTVLLGVAAELAALRRTLPGKVRLIFQPAEEAPVGGAETVISEGGLDGVSEIFCLHCDPAEDAGRVGIRTGPLTASLASIKLRLHNKVQANGHASFPDLIYIMGQIVRDLPVSLLQVGRAKGYSGSVVFGAFNSYGLAADDGGVEVAGTLRSLDGAGWSEGPNYLRSIIDSSLSPYGIRYELDYHEVAPPVVNDVNLAVLVQRAAGNVVGAGGLYEPPQSLGGEDFSWYLKYVPGFLARLGVRRPGTQVAPDLHTGTFDVDENAIAVGVDLLVELVRLRANGEQAFRSF